MSGILDEDGLPEDRAGLYVLGVLDGTDMDAVRRDAANDPALASAITDWEERMAPLAVLAGEVAPPLGVWPAVQARLGIGKPVLGQNKALAVWRTAALGSMAIAAGLAVVLVLRTQSLVPVAGPARLAMILPMAQTQGGWLVELRPDGSLRAIATGGVSHTPDRDFELWALAEKATKPVPLGLLPVRAEAALHPAGLPTVKFKLLVSLEPKGGSPTGLPTGPVMFAGDVVVPPS